MRYQSEGQVTYLGAIINKDKNTRCPLDFSPIIEKTQKKLNSWLQRDLSLRGRLLLTKVVGISRLAYLAASLDADSGVSKRIDNMFSNFVWKNKTHFVKVCNNEHKSMRGPTFFVAPESECCEGALISLGH